MTIFWCIVRVQSQNVGVQLHPVLQRRTATELKTIWRLVDQLTVASDAAQIQLLLAGGDMALLNLLKCELTAAKDLLVGKHLL